MFTMKYVIAVAAVLAGSGTFAQTTNLVPFSDSFEEYNAGTSLDGTNGWLGAGGVTNLSYTYDDAQHGFPVSGTHTNVLKTESGVTNLINGASSSAVWVDSIISAESFWSGPAHPAVDSNVNVCVYINTNGNLVAGHTEVGSSNLTWSVFNGFSISSNDWNRLTLELDYVTHHYAIMMNGLVLEHAGGAAERDGSGSGGPWFPMIGNFPLSAIALEGAASIDDVSVTADAPYASITVQDAGSIAEGDSGTTLAAFTILLSTNTAVPVSFDYATADGSAVAGVDYIAKSGSLIIPAGASQATVNVEVIGDTDTESDVDFTLNISNTVNAIVDDASGSATVVDDDIVVSADLVVTGSTMKVTDGAPNNSSGGITNFFSASETVDWMVWDTSLVPSERKSGGSGLKDFSSVHVWAQGTGNRIFTAWEDGAVVQSATNFSGVAMADAGQDVPYTVLEFSVELAAVTEGGYYKLRIYSTDKRSNTAVNYWDPDVSSFVTASSETDNDAADLRIHELVISNVTANATLPLQITGERTGGGFPFVLGGMELILVGSLAPPPVEDGYAIWAGEYNLTGSNAVLTADADGSGFNNLYEYAFGGNPTNPTDNGQDPAHELNGDQIEYIYLRRNDSNLTYIVQVGTNLVSGLWTTNGVTESGLAAVNSDFEIVTNLVDTAARENGFIRVNVDAP